MFASLPPIRLTGAMALREGEFQARTVALAHGRISAGPFPDIDLSGYLILPGIVDLHHSGALRQITPGAISDGGIAHIDQEAAAHGVTTRAVTVPWSWERPAAGPDAAKITADCWRQHRSRALIDLQLQLRTDPHMVESADALVQLVRDHAIAQVLFQDLASATRELRYSEPAEYARWCWRNGLRPMDTSAALDQVLAQKDRVPRHLCHLAEIFDDIGVLYGSIGDPDAETREHLSMIGARLCVDPATSQVAGAAYAVGDPVLLSADQVLHPHVADQKLDAVDLIRSGHCDALVSGAHSASLVQAVFHLAHQGVMSLAEAWALISTRPAAIQRLPDRGEIAHGRRADLTIIHAETQMVEATISAGHLAYLSGEAANRFMGLRGDLGSHAAE